MVILLAPSPSRLRYDFQLPSREVGKEGAFQRNDVMDVHQ